MTRYGSVIGILDKYAYHDEAVRVVIQFDDDQGRTQAFVIVLDYAPSLGEPVEIEINIGGR